MSHAHHNTDPAPEATGERHRNAVKRGAAAAEDPRLAPAGVREVQRGREAERGPDMPPFRDTQVVFFQVAGAVQKGRSARAGGQEPEPQEQAAACVRHGGRRENPGGTEGQPVVVGEENPRGAHEGDARRGSAERRHNRADNQEVRHVLPGGHTGAQEAVEKGGENEREEAQALRTEGGGAGGNHRVRHEAHKPARAEAVRAVRDRPVHEAGGGARLVIMRVKEREDRAHEDTGALRGRNRHSERQRQREQAGGGGMAFRREHNAVLVPPAQT